MVYVIVKESNLEGGFHSCTKTNLNSTVLTYHLHEGRMTVSTYNLCLPLGNLGLVREEVYLYIG